MASKNVPAATSIELVKTMLDEIAGTAHGADRKSFHFDMTGDREALALHADALRDTICRIGWIAEQALGELGGQEFWRGALAENWLMPPGCRKSEGSA